MYFAKVCWFTMLMLCGADASSESTTTSRSVQQIDIDFLTRVVSDVYAHPGEYWYFSRTADVHIPKQFESLANEITSYTDDSYTTLLQDPDFDITNLEKFATNLDWYNDRLSISGLTPSTLKDSTGTMASIPFALALVAGIIGVL